MAPFFLAALVAASLRSSALAQSAAAPDSDLPKIARRLADVRALTPSAARAALKARADRGDAPSRELLAALQARPAAAALGARLAPLDGDGALRAELRTFAETLDAARRGGAALANADKAVAPLPAAAEASDDDKQGWDNAAETFAGAAAAAGQRLPATGLADQAEYNRGPWKAELGFRALFTPDGKGTPVEGDLEAAGTRQLGDDPRLRAFAGTELHRDDLMGIQHDFSVHGGVEGDAIASKLQTLTFGFGLGAGQERHLDGESERHPIVLTRVEYDLKVSARAAFAEEFEFEQNPLSRGDYELSSVTSFVYKLSEKWSLRLSHEISGRGQPVPGYAPTRAETTLGLVLH
jgi:hypothetical protein